MKIQIVTWSTFLLSCFLCLLQSTSAIGPYVPKSEKGIRNSVKQLRHLMTKVSSKKEIVASIRKRRDAHGGSISAKERLDNQIYFLINEDLPSKIENAVNAVELDIRNSNFLSLSQGWSIIIGSWLDILEDVVANNRTFNNLGGTVDGTETIFGAAGGVLTVNTNDLDTVLFDYGFLGFYGLGFGGPLILGLPDYELGCGSGDFSSLIKQYGLGYGLSTYFPSYDQSLTSSLSSRVSEFELLSAARLDCVLSKEGDSLEAAEVVWALEELISALNLRLELEDQDDDGYSKYQKSFAI